jgi:hypothetical protein
MGCSQRDKDELPKIQFLQLTVFFNKGKGGAR